MTDEMTVDGETTEQYLQRFMNDCHKAGALSEEAEVEILSGDWFFDELKRAIDLRVAKAVAEAEQEAKQP